ncbi:tetratricopeptide repeat-containing sensor histidine kinase [Spirosoma rhododendri]|uniref:Two-component sensor histidine kinase n=1 Tax=Spirosoma rhododendri TaxID=2728024 RepID=A0A7L5DGG8_9BACT|nr:histidine kinase [Spirosoma rhododendri]QJD77336.1 two-component sensor histidine kinase [Spirosoma rhododendri]
MYRGQSSRYVVITLLLAGLLIGYCQPSVGQPIPALLSNRRGNVAYMDSMARVIKQHYARLATTAATPRTDTLLFQCLYRLSQLYQVWSGRRDSLLYFGNELVRQAHDRKNLFYEVNGKLLLEAYYRTGEINTPKALRLNLDVLSLIPPDKYYDNVRFQANLHLGSLYKLSTEYAKALHYTELARQVIIRDTVYRSAITNSLLIDLEQHVGSIYNRQGRFQASEQHYLKAESMLNRTSSEAEYGYVFDDLAELYLKYGHYGQALHYGKKAEAVWERIKSTGESKGWGTLASIYAGLGNDELAIWYAQKVLHLARPNKFVLEQAYRTLYLVAERQHDWQRAMGYYKRYVTVRDSIESDRRGLELMSIEKQAEYDQLALQSKQAQQLQAERVRTVEQEKQLVQLRADAEADRLYRRNLLTEKLRMLDKERADAQIAQQQARHRLQQQDFDRTVEQQADQTQRNWLFFGFVSTLLLLVALGLLLYSTRLRKRQADANLRLAYERKATDARIIQTQESERARLAADLHDDLGGTLATLNRRLTDMQDLVQDDAGQQAFADLVPLVQKSSDDLRRIAHNLMPPEFARIGLRYALEQLVQSQPLVPTRFTFLVSGNERRLPLDTELNLYRIVSEQVQNVNKHAKAGRAAVQLLYYDDKLTITVEDDGLGNRTTLAGNSPGIGLKTSKLRAEYIGATLWRDASEAGTLVVLEITYPLHIHEPPQPRPPATD